MKHRVPHQLEEKRAKKMIRQAFETYAEHYAEYSIETDWVDEETARVGFEVTGRRVDGEVRVRDGAFEVDFDLPWVFRPFKKKIAQTLDREFERWIESA